MDAKFPGTTTQCFGNWCNISIGCKSWFSTKIGRIEEFPSMRLRRRDKQKRQIKIWIQFTFLMWLTPLYNTLALVSRVLTTFSWNIKRTHEHCGLNISVYFNPFTGEHERDRVYESVSSNSISITFWIQFKELEMQRPRKRHMSRFWLFGKETIGIYIHRFHSKLLYAYLIFSEFLLPYFCSFEDCKVDNMHYKHNRSVCVRLFLPRPSCVSDVKLLLPISSRAFI